jgi:hypothetical protein
MYLCYIDESGDPGKNGSKHLVLGAAMVFEGVWRDVQTDIEVLIGNAFPSPMQRPAELHMTELRRGKGCFYQLDLNARAELESKFCSMVGSYLDKEISFIAAGADKGEWLRKNPGKDGYDLYTTLFEQIVSRFDLYLRRRHAAGEPNKGMVVLDEHSTNLAGVLKKKYSQVQRVGTQWYPTHNLIETALFLPSHESPGLQLADLCAYAAFRLLESGDVTLASKVRDCFDREPSTAA